MPAVLLWALLLLLAVPALALAETEAPASGGPALVDESAPVEQYGTLPNGDEEIQFEPASVVPATSESAEPAPVTPAPVDPVTDPAPVDPIPPDPVGEEPIPTDPVEEPVGETPVEEPPVGSVIENSPEQEPGGYPVYTPPVVDIPVEIPVAAADPLPAEVIPTDLVTRFEPQAPAAETAVPPSTAAPIARPTVTAATIPSAVLSAGRPIAPKPDSQFSTGADLVRAVALPPAATPRLPETQGGLPGAGVGYEEAAANPFLARLTSPMGPAPTSQFFEVLAQYVMAGGSGPPTGVALLLLVQIATVVGAFAWRTPRSMFQMLMGVSDRLFVGYRAVALRPG